MLIIKVINYVRLIDLYQKINTHFLFSGVPLQLIGMDVSLVFTIIKIYSYLGNINIEEKAHTAK